METKQDISEKIEQPYISSIDRIYIIFLIIIAFLLGLAGLYRYAYIGQDFLPHRDNILNFPQGYTYQASNPVGLYWLGSLIHNHFTSKYYLEAITFLFIIINTCALLGIYRLIWQMLDAWALRYAASALVTVVPFRVVHSVVLAADAFTIPVFTVMVFLTLRLIERPKSIFAWLCLCVSLCVGILTKYTFIGVMAPLALIITHIIWKQIVGVQRIYWCFAALLMFALPLAIFLHTIVESKKAHGWTTSGHWKSAGADPIMGWREILTLNPNDTQIFSAPEYLKDHLYEDRKFSYIALVYISTFTDCSNLFQGPPPEVSKEWSQRTQNEFGRTRTEQAKALMSQACIWSVPYIVFAIVGTAFCLLLSFPALLGKTSLLRKNTAIIALMAAGFYGPIIMSLPHVSAPYGAGYWLSRLIMPSLIIFLLLGFIFLETSMNRIPFLNKYIKSISAATLVYTVVACGLFLSFLA
jgi:4-amino-4-deoxy-L-arabinose transferase-like glycosyltransferase